MNSRILPDKPNVWFEYKSLRGYYIEILNGINIQFQIKGTTLSFNLNYTDNVAGKLPKAHYYSKSNEFDGILYVNNIDEAIHDVEWESRSFVAMKSSTEAYY